MKRKTHSLTASSAAIFRRVLSGCAVFLLLAGSAVPRLLAQASAGLTGTVTDPSGSVIQGATVTIVSKATHITTTRVTSSAGTYSVIGLLPDRYNVIVEAQGFSKTVKNNVNIDVSTIATVNFALVTGGASETVEVTANSIALNTTQPQLGTTIEPEVVNALPNEVSGRGRQIDALQFLAPGTTGDTFSHRISGGVDFQQEILYNGIAFPQPETEGYTTNVNPPFEMVQEFRVERTTFAAQFGLGQGVLTYQMASGTNRYHGDLFEILKNTAFDSPGFFQGKVWKQNGKAPVDKQNNYGFTVGGPLSIPHLYNARDKTFFHYSQEWFKLVNQNTSTATVPTALEKTGNFTDFVDGKGVLIPIYDPLTGKQFQCNGVLNTICPDRFSPASVALLKYIPNPDLPGSNGGLDQNKNYVPFPIPSIQHVFGFTIDQVLTAKQNLHYSQWRNSYTTQRFDRPAFVLPPNPLSSLRYFPTVGSGYLLNYSNAVTSNLVTTAGIGWFGEINNQFNQLKYSTPLVVGSVVPPSITFGGQHGPTPFGTSGANTGSVNRKLGITLVNNWLWTKGRHTFNIGGEFRRTYQDDNEEQTAGGHFNFSNHETSTPLITDPVTGKQTTNPNFGNYGSGFASFLLGLPDSVNRSNSQELRLRNLDLSPYVQDDIKFTPKLTVNLGLRWDIQVPFTENNNLIVFLNPTAPNPHANNLPGAATQFGNCMGCSGYTRADTHYTHFGPRVGFAYQLNTKTVLQGGFSIAFLNGGAYEYGTSKVAVNYGNLLVGSFTRDSTGTNASAYGSWDANPLPNPQPSTLNPALGVGTQINAFSRKDGYAPYAQQWSVNLQRQLPQDVFLTVAWVGNRVIHLPSHLNNPNQLDPKYLALKSDLGLSFKTGAAQKAGYKLPYDNFVADFGGSATVAQSLRPYPQYSNVFNNFEASGTTYYQGLQVEAEKRYTNGLSFLLGYTLSRSYDNASSGFSSFSNGALNKYNQKAEYTISSSDSPNTFKASGVYDLPIGPGKKYLSKKGLVGEVTGGWQIGYILDYEQGTPFGVGSNVQGLPNGGNRPDRNASVPLGTRSYQRERDFFLGKRPTAQIFNPAAFTPTAPYVLGNAVRNYSELRYPGYANEDFDLHKKFFFTERFSGTLKFDLFNALNRTRFNGPDTNANDANFGQAVFTGQANQNRRGQLEVRLEF